MALADTWAVRKSKTASIPTQGTFWERLIQASEWAGVACTPSDIAKELGIVPSAVTKYVDGGFPKKANINRLALKRRVRAEWLLSGQGTMVAEEALSDKTQDMLRVWRTLPDDAQERLLANMRYEYQAAVAITTGKRQILTDELIKLLETERKQ